MTGGYSAYIYAFQFVEAPAVLIKNLIHSSVSMIHCVIQVLVSTADCSPCVQ